MEGAQVPSLPGQSVPVPRGFSERSPAAGGGTGKQVLDESFSFKRFSTEMGYSEGTETIRTACLLATNSTPPCSRVTASCNIQRGAEVRRGGSFAMPRSGTGTKSSLRRGEGPCSAPAARGGTARGHGPRREFLALSSGVGGRRGHRNRTNFHLLS